MMWANRMRSGASSMLVPLRTVLALFVLVALSGYIFGYFNSCLTSVASRQLPSACRGSLCALSHVDADWSIRTQHLWRRTLKESAPVLSSNTPTGDAVCPVQPGSFQGTVVSPPNTVIALYSTYAAQQQGSGDFELLCEIPFTASQPGILMTVAFDEPMARCGPMGVHTEGLEIRRAARGTIIRVIAAAPTRGSEASWTEIAVKQTILSSTTVVNLDESTNTDDLCVTKHGSAQVTGNVAKVTVTMAEGVTVETLRYVGSAVALQRALLDGVTYVVVTKHVPLRSISEQLSGTLSSATPSPLNSDDPHASGLDLDEAAYRMHATSALVGQCFEAPEDEELAKDWVPGQCVLQIPLSSGILIDAFSPSAASARQPVLLADLHVQLVRSSGSSKVHRAAIAVNSRQARLKNLTIDVYAATAHEANTHALALFNSSGVHVSSCNVRYAGIRAAVHLAASAVAFQSCTLKDLTWQPNTTARALLLDQSSAMLLEASSLPGDTELAAASTAEALGCPAATAPAVAVTVDVATQAATVDDGSLPVPVYSDVPRCLDLLYVGAEGGWQPSSAATLAADTPDDRVLAALAAGDDTQILEIESKLQPFLEASSTWEAAAPLPARRSAHVSTAVLITGIVGWLVAAVSTLALLWTCTSRRLSTKSSESMDDEGEGHVSGRGSMDSNNARSHITLVIDTHAPCTTERGCDPPSEDGGLSATFSATSGKSRSRSWRFWSPVERGSGGVDGAHAHAHRESKPSHARSRTAPCVPFDSPRHGHGGAYALHGAPSAPPASGPLSSASKPSSMRSGPSSPLAGGLPPRSTLLQHSDTEKVQDGFSKSTLGDRSGLDAAVAPPLAMDAATRDVLHALSVQIFDGTLDGLSLASPCRSCAPSRHENVLSRHENILQERDDESALFCNVIDADSCHSVSLGGMQMPVASKSTAALSFDGGVSKLPNPAAEQAFAASVLRPSVDLAPAQARSDPSESALPQSTMRSWLVNVPTANPTEAGAVAGPHTTSGTANSIALSSSRPASIQELAGRADLAATRTGTTADSNASRRRTGSQSGLRGLLTGDSNTSMSPRKSGAMLQTGSASHARARSSAQTVMLRISTSERPSMSRPLEPKDAASLICVELASESCDPDDEDDDKLDSGDEGEGGAKRTRSWTHDELNEQLDMLCAQGALLADRFRITFGRRGAAQTAETAESTTSAAPSTADAGRRGAQGLVAFATVEDPALLQLPGRKIAEQTTNLDSEQLNAIAYGAWTNVAIKFHLNERAYERERQLSRDPRLANCLPDVLYASDEGEGPGLAPNGKPWPKFLVLPRGESLDEYVIKRAVRSPAAGVDPVTCIQILVHLATQLDALHTAGLVHGDVKPGNIVFLDEWKLIDFGNARWAGQDVPLCLTPEFAAPEQVALWLRLQVAHEQGRTVSVEEAMLHMSPALDVWALGLVAYRLLADPDADPVMRVGRRAMWALLHGPQPLPWELYPDYFRTHARFRGLGPQFAYWI